jgi:hypothetical protein
MSGCNHNDLYSDDAKIAKSADSYSAVMSIGNTEENEYSLSATMTGMQTIWRYKVDSDSEITISYMLSVSQGGKAKLVLITPNNEVIELAENTDNTETTEMQSQTIQLTKGNNRIKIVGYDKPKFELKLNVDVGQLGTE